MTNALVVQTRKEVRGLLPWTIGVAIASVAMAIMTRRKSGLIVQHDQDMFFVMAYAMGVLAVAALSVGQELTHGTLANLLVQPFDRLKVLGLKLTVLSIALASLGLVANGMFPHGDLFYSDLTRRVLIWGPVVTGIGLVPLLTVLTRRPLGAAVFGIAIPGAILTIADRVYPPDNGLQTWSVTWYGTLIASALGLIALVLQFRRLEVAGDERQRATSRIATQVADAPVAAYQPTVRRPWPWLLLKKELRLQQLTFAVSGLYLLAVVAVMIVSYNNPAYMGPRFGTISIIHAYFVPLIAGSLASAEERHMGTLAGQILQPRNLRLQWAIKVVLTIGLTLTLAFGLPTLLMAIHRPVDAFRIHSEFMIGAAMLAVAAIYVSSISNNSLWALLGSFPAIGAAVLLGGFGSLRLGQLLQSWFAPRARTQNSWAILLSNTDFRQVRGEWSRHYAAFRDVDASLRLIEFSLVAGFALLVLHFARRNHRTLDRGLRTVAGQMLALLLFAAVAYTGYSAILRTAYTWLGW